MAIDSTTSTSTPTPTPTPSPEIHLYLGYLVLLYLHDTAAYTKAAALSTSLVAKFQAANKRSLDPLGARIYFYHARFLELGDKWLAVRP